MDSNLKAHAYWNRRRSPAGISTELLLGFKADAGMVRVGKAYISRRVILIGQMLCFVRCGVRLLSPCNGKVSELDYENFLRRNLKSLGATVATGCYATMENLAFVRLMDCVAKSPLQCPNK